MLGENGGGVPILFRQFLDFENFYKCLIFPGGKKHFFFKKCPNNGLVSEKKYIIFSVTLGGGMGVGPDCNICYNFFFFLNEGFPN